MSIGLLIDEQRNQHKMLRMVIEQNFSAEADSAYSLRSAEEFLSEKRYDFIIVDPKTENFAKCLNIILTAKKSGSITPYCVVLVVSSDSSSKFVACCADIQPDDFLIKPTKNSDFIARLNAALERKSSIKLPYAEYERTGKSTDAQRLFNHSIKLAKSSFQQQFLLKTLASFQMSTGNLVQAQLSIGKLIKLNNGPQAKLLTASLLLAKNEEEDAITILEDTLKSHPMLMSAYDLLAEAGYKTGNAKLGLKARVKANSINPLNASRSLLLANEAFDLGDLDIAKNTIEYQIDNLPELETSTRFGMLAQIHLAQNNLEAGLKVLNIAEKKMGAAFIAKSPQLTIALLHTAIEQHKKELAFEMLERIIKIDETNTGPKNYLFEAAICAYQLRETEQGDHWLDRVLTRQSLTFSQFQRIKESMKVLNLLDRLNEITLKAGKARANHNERQAKFKEAGLHFEMAQELIDIAEHPDSDIEAMQQALEALVLAKQHGQLHQAVDLVVETLRQRIILLKPNSTAEAALLRSLALLSTNEILTPDSQAGNL